VPFALRIRERIRSRRVRRQILGLPGRGPRRACSLLGPGPWQRRHRRPKSRPDRV